MARLALTQAVDIVERAPSPPWAAWAAAELAVRRHGSSITSAADLGT